MMEFLKDVLWPSPGPLWTRGEAYWWRAYIVAACLVFSYMIVILVLQ